MKANGRLQRSLQIIGEIQNQAKKNIELRSAAGAGLTRAEALEELQTCVEELWVVGEDLRRQNQELFRERQRYADLFNFAPDAYLVTDPEGIIQEANQAAAKLFDCPQEFLRGKPLVVFVTEEERRAFRTRLTSLKTGGVEKVDDWRVTIRPRQSPPFHAIMTVSAKRDPVSRFIGIRWLVRASLDGSALPSPPL